MTLLVAACTGTGQQAVVDTDAVEIADKMMRQGRFDTAAALYAQTLKLTEGQRRLKLAAVALAKGHHALADHQIRLAEQAGMPDEYIIEARAWLFLHQRQLDKAADSFAALASLQVHTRKDLLILQAVSLDLGAKSDKAAEIWQQIPASVDRDINYGIHLALVNGPNTAIDLFRRKLAVDPLSDADRQLIRQNLAMMLVWTTDIDAARLVLANTAEHEALITEYARLRQSTRQARLLLWQWLVQSSHWIPKF